MSDELPKGWSMQMLLDVVPRAEYGVSVPLEEGEHGIPVLRMNNLRDGRIDVSDTKRSSDPLALALTLRPSDVLFNRTNSLDHVGKTALWRGELEDASFASYLVRLIPDPDKLDPEYLVSWLNLPEIQLLIRRFATPGVHQVNINPTNLRRVSIELPDDTEEQRRIATILTTLDEVIAATEKLVEKHQQIKTGLMHDLFTRGLWTRPELARGDHKGLPSEATAKEGHLRPTPEEAPGLYQESPLGLIPKTWIAEPLRYFVPQVRYGVSVSMDEDSSGVPVLRMNNLGNGRIDVSDIKYSGSLEAQSLLLRNGDVLFNRTNSLEHVGKSAIWKDELDATSFASYLVRLDPDPLKMSPEFLTQWLNLHRTQLAIRRYATPGVHQVNINPTSLRQVDCAAPTDLDEQHTIQSRIEELDRHRLTNDQHLAKLRQQKQGLMHDLLTGQVRVKKQTL